MWKERLEEIRQEEKRYGQDINCGISEEEAGTFIKVGFILYGVDEPLLNEAPNQHINGLIDCNKVWYENEWQKQYLFLGEGSISWYVYDLKTKKYYELDNPSGEAGEEFNDCESMLDKMFEDSLR